MDGIAEDYVFFLVGIYADFGIWYRRRKSLDAVSSLFLNFVVSEFWSLVGVLDFGLDDKEVYSVC